MNKITQYCTLHYNDKAWIDEATSNCPWCEIERLRRNVESSNDQFVWLCGWLRDRLQIDNNSVIGRDGWPLRCVEVVAKAVDDELEQLKKSSCHVFRVTNGDVLGTCYAFYDFFDVYWDDGTSNLALAELSVYGIRKTCQDT